MAVAVASCIIFASMALVPNAGEPEDQKANAFEVDFMEFALSPSLVYVGEEVTFWANASSATSSTLNFTIYYDGLNPWTPNPASAVTVNVTGNPGAVVQKHTFNSLGNFTGAYSYFYVLLFVDDGYSNESITRIVYVRENGPPEFILAPGDDATPLDVPLNISIQVYDPDSDPLDVFWEFGDGDTATNATDGTYEDRFVNQTHTWSPYIPPGSGGYNLYYTLNVTVTDTFGNNISASVTITVVVPTNSAPTIAITSSSMKIQPGEELLIWANATDAEGDPLTWTFNYSDGTPLDVVHTGSSEPGALVWCNMTHVYDAEGSYTITMWVSDAVEGYQVFPHNKSASVYVEVAENQIPEVTSVISVSPYSPEIDVAVGFLEVSLIIQAIDRDGDVLTATWIIEGIADPLVNVSAGGVSVYKFVQIMNVTETGSYDVMVVVTDGYEGHEVARSLTVNVTSNNLPPCLTSFEFAYPPGLSFGIVNDTNDFAMSFSDPENDTIEVIISFGDGTPDVRVNLTDFDVSGNVSYAFSHVYSYPGEFTMTVNYTDNQIGWLTHEKQVNVYLYIVKDDTPPVANAGEDATVSPGETVSFSSAGSDDDIGIANYTWSFIYDGKMVFLYGEAPEFTFWIVGVYEVQLEVRDYGGNHNTSTVVISVVEVIPEFSSVLMPVLGIIMVVALFAIMRRRPA